jgi:hypothetical protein
MDDYDESTGGTLQPNGDGFLSHCFGVYANILRVPRWNFALGYSGYLRTFEDLEIPGTGKIKTKSGPLFSGIDLRATYSGIQKTRITSQNNISFATSDKTTEDHTSIGVWHRDLALGHAQSWFALYNALGIDYNLSNSYILSLQLGSRLGAVTTTVTPPSGSEYTIKTQLLKLGAGGSIAYQVNSFLRFQGGINVLYINSTYTNTDPNPANAAAARDSSGGTLNISIPLRMFISFRNQ